MKTLDSMIDQANRRASDQSDYEALVTFTHLLAERHGDTPAARELALRSVWPDHRQYVNGRLGWDLHIIPTAIVLTGTMPA